jgi:hypothetical protein
VFFWKVSQVAGSPRMLEQDRCFEIGSLEFATVTCTHCLFGFPRISLDGDVN